MASLPVKIVTSVDDSKLAVGEIVVNSTTGEVWTKTSTGEVKKVGSDNAYLLNRANHTGTQPMASIGDKQGKVLDDLTPLLYEDLDSAVEPKGYLVSHAGGFFDGAQLFVQQTPEGLVAQTMHLPLLGKSSFRTKPVGGAWSDASFTIAPFDIVGWHDNTTTDAPNAVINDDGTFSRSISSFVPEAPDDGKQYARKNAGWVEVTGGDGGGSSAWADITGKPAVIGAGSNITNAQVAMGIIVSSTAPVSPAEGTIWIKVV